MQRLMLSLVAIGSFLGGASPARANLITNGGFETGDFTGWTAAPTTLVTTAPFGNFSPHSGTHFAALGSLSLGTLSQTINDVAGQSYTLAMYLGSDGGLPNQFIVQWNGATLSDQSSLLDTRGNSSQYNLLTFTVTGTGTDTLTLFEQNGPGFLALDDVSLNATSTPEPSTLVLSSIVLGLFAAAANPHV